MNKKFVDEEVWTATSTFISRRRFGTEDPHVQKLTEALFEIIKTMECEMLISLHEIYARIDWGERSFCCPKEERDDLWSQWCQLQSKTYKALREMRDLCDKFTADAMNSSGQRDQIELFWNCATRLRKIQYDFLEQHIERLNYMIRVKASLLRDTAALELLERHLILAIDFGKVRDKCSTPFFFSQHDHEYCVNTLKEGIAFYKGHIIAVKAFLQEVKAAVQEFFTAEAPAEDQERK